MRVYSPIRVGAFGDKNVQKEMHKVNTYLRQISTQTARMPVYPQGTSGYVAQAVSFDVDNFLYLPGRTPWQWAKGNVQFSARGNADSVTTASFETSKYMVLRAQSVSGVNFFVDSVSFQVEASGTNRHTEWIFPTIATQATFASTSSTQTLSNKTLESGVIVVGNSGTRNLFQDAASSSRQFTLVTSTSGWSAGIPSLRFSSLDNTDDKHTFVMLHDNVAAPFPAGSIIYGNAAGTEMVALANGTSGQVLTSGGTTVAPSWSSVSGLTYLDSTFRISDDGDNTKKIAFEASGITTGTTRTYTAPNYDGTLILSQGSATLGQVIGTTSHSSGTANDLAIEGKLLLGNNIASTAFSTPALNILTSGTTPAAIFTATPSATNFTGFTMSTSVANISGAFSGNLRVAQFTTSGTPTSTSGTLTAASALFNSMSMVVPSGTTVTLYSGGDFQAAPSSVDGTITTMVGNRVLMQGPQLGSGTISAIGGMLIQTNQRAFTVGGTLFGLNFSQGSGTALGTVANFVGIDFSASSMIADTTATTNWYGIRITNPSNPTGTKLGLYSQIPSVTNRLRLDSGSVSPTHWLEISAGTTAIAPIKLTSGTSLTAPVAGAIEFTTDDFFATISTGPARKAFVLDDGTRLTSGVVPIATTNGRLIDHPNLVATDANVVCADGDPVTYDDDLVLV